MEKGGKKKMNGDREGKEKEREETDREMKRTMNCRSKKKKRKVGKSSVGTTGQGEEW